MEKEGMVEANGIEMCYTSVPLKDGTSRVCLWEANGWGREMTIVVESADPTEDQIRDKVLEHWKRVEEAVSTFADRIRRSK